MGEPLELVFRNGQGGLSVWPLTDVDAWQAAASIAGAQPAGVIAAARPQTASQRNWRADVSRDSGGF